VPHLDWSILTTCLEEGDPARAITMALEGRTRRTLFAVASRKPNSVRCHTVGNSGHHQARQLQSPIATRRLPHPGHQNRSTQANARYARAPRAFYGYVPGYRGPRRFYERPCMLPTRRLHGTATIRALRTFSSDRGADGSGWINVPAGVSLPGVFLRSH
jgi:hypothetical protein